jgi:glycosyltransferase involved in cell wall biosynthesis
MKIVHVTGYPSEGTKHSGSGVASYAYDLIRSFSTGHEHHVLCLVRDVAGDYISDGVSVHERLRRGWRFFPDLWRWVRSNRPDIVHIQHELRLYGILNAFTMSFMTWSLKGKLVVTMHGVFSLRLVNRDFIKRNGSMVPSLAFKVALWLATYPLCLASSKVIVHEEDFKQILTDEYGIDSQKVVVISHGVGDGHDRMPKAEARKHLLLSVDKKICLFVGYASGYKGMDVLIEGFAEAARFDSNLYLIIGAGQHPKLQEDRTYQEAYQAWQDKAAKLIDGSQFEWRGFVPEKDLPAVYGASDVAIFPYTEHISSSGPVSLSITWETPYLLSEKIAQAGETSFSVDSAGLATAIISFFRNGEDNREEVARIRKAERLWSKVALKTQLLYEDTIRSS